MFELPPSKKEEKPGSNLEMHNKIMRGIGDILLTTGTVFALAGIYEFITGDKFPDVLSSIDPSMVPDILLKLSRNLSNMPMMMKVSTAPGMIFVGQYIKEKLGKTDQ